MSEWLEAAVLGIIQGLTEFLPVSSSGHLEIAKYLLGDEAIGHQSLLMTVTLHVATALATIVVYRKDVTLILCKATQKGKERNFLFFILLSMLPAMAVGLIFETSLESMFSQNMPLIAMMLLVTGILLFICESVPSGQRPLNWFIAVVVGLAQALAIVPGISRSGATISTSLLLGMDRTQAARFSFLMVIPLILGKLCKDVAAGDYTSESIDPLPLFAGGLTAFIVGGMACKWMIAIIQRARLRYFSVYCVIVAALLFVM